MASISDQISSPSSISYTVYPSDLSNQTQLHNTEILLGNLFPGSKIQLDYDHSNNLAWCITSDQDHLQETLIALEGVRNVELGFRRDEAEATLTARSPGQPFRPDLKYYVLAAKPGSDVQATKEFLKTKVQDNEEIYDYPDDDGAIIGWGHLAIDDSVVEEVENHEGVQAPLMREDDDELRAISTNEITEKTWSSLSTFSKARKLLARAISWKKQENADWALVMDSQYHGLNIDNYKDFIHATDAGKDTYIYVIDSGVQLNAQNPDGQNEFNSDNLKVLATTKALAIWPQPITDYSSASHGTNVASKACGMKYGVAKAAKVIPVKYYPGEPRDFKEALNLIIKDINDNEGRNRRSVVVLSKKIMTEKPGVDPRQNMIVLTQLLTPLLGLFDLGVPVIMAAGNFRTQSGDRNDIDILPQMLEREETPIINVGANDRQGQAGFFSQRGSHLTIYAPGYRVACMDKQGSEKLATGTSSAAPQVAGLIATYMSYDQKPWDDSLTGRDRVRAIKNYLLTEDASWIRKDGSDVRIIWNGATENDHQSSSTDSSPQATKALSIIMQNHFLQDTKGVEINDNSWLFFETNKGQSALCQQETDALLRTPMDKNANVNNPPWPGGTYNLRINDMDCQYKNNGANPGALWCNGNNVPVTCYEDSMKAQQTSQNCGGAPSTYTQHSVVHCDF